VVFVSCRFEVCVFRIGWLGVVLLVLTLIATGAACRGDGDTSDTLVVVKSTYTPRPAGETPAAATDVAASPTLVAPTPNGPRQPTPTAGPNEIRPPELVLVTSAGQSVGLVAANAWFDPETETFSGFEFSGQVILATDPIEWPQDTQASFEVGDSPYPAGTTEVAIYPHDTNVAIPQNAQGQVMGSDLVFTKLTEPVQELTLQGPALTVPAPVSSGKYIVDVTIHWTVPADIAQRLQEDVQQEAMTQYVFVVVLP
jgi:hypothetical protein